MGVADVGLTPKFIWKYKIYQHFFKGGKHSENNVNIIRILIELLYDIKTIYTIQLSTIKVIFERKNIILKLKKLWFKIIYLLITLKELKKKT